MGFTNKTPNKNSVEGLCSDYKKLFTPGFLYLPILLFDFGTSQQTILVLLRQDQYKESFFMKFFHKKSFSLSEMEINKVDRY